jgi:hypothetical protein
MLQQLMHWKTPERQQQGNKAVTINGEVCPGYLQQGNKIRD